MAVVHVVQFAADAGFHQEEELVRRFEGREEFHHEVGDDFVAGLTVRRWKIFPGICSICSAAASCLLHQVLLLSNYTCATLAHSIRKAFLFAT